MLTRMSPCKRCNCLSGALNPALSSISLLASNWTYSDLAEDDSVSILFTAFVAPSPIVSCTCFIIYSCTCGCFKALLAVTLPDSPLAYPAICDASVIEQPFATIVSTSSCCFVVSCALYAAKLLIISVFFSVLIFSSSIFCCKTLSNLISNFLIDLFRCSIIFLSLCFTKSK